MRGRRLANVMATVFFVGVGAAVGLIARDLLRSNSDPYDVRVLTQDLAAFTGPDDDPAGVIDTFPCTGEGSVAAAAQRVYVVPGTIDAVQQSVAAEAANLGWLAVPPPVEGFDHIEVFEQGDRSLRIEVTPAGDSHVEIDLGVSGGDVC